MCLAGLALHSLSSLPFSFHHFCFVTYSLCGERKYSNFLCSNHYGTVVRAIQSLDRLWCQVYEPSGYSVYELLGTVASYSSTEREHRTDQAPDQLSS